jgi:hypothetical protein
MLVPFPFLQNFCVYASKKVQKGAKRGCSTPNALEQQQQQQQQQ